MSLSNEDFHRNSAEFLVDCGAQLNLIKARAVSDDNDLYIDRNKTFNITGIGHGMIKTQGEITSSIKGEDVTFQVVGNDFPIPKDGILGLSFLIAQEAMIKFKRRKVSTITIGNKEYTLGSHATSPVHLPPRALTLITVPIKNKEQKEGYLKRIDAGPGIFLWEALVRPENGVAHVYAVNSTPVHVQLSIPPIELTECETLDVPPDLSRASVPRKEKRRARVARLDELHKVLKLSTLNEEEQTAIMEVISEFPDQFRLSGDKLGCTDVISHKITTTHDRPINVKQYRLSQVHKKEVDSQVKTLLEDDVIEVSDSPYNSPIWIIPKKPDSSGKPRFRMVIDYHSLNRATVKDSYPLPLITDILDQLGSAKYFSTLDLSSGFHQIPIDPESRPKTAFSTPYGHYQYKKMSFGLAGAPHTFQRCMDKVLCGLQGVEMFIFMDDCVIFSETIEEHVAKL